MTGASAVTTTPAAADYYYLEVCMHGGRMDGCLSRTSVRKGCSLFLSCLSSHSNPITHRVMQLRSTKGFGCLFRLGRPVVVPKRQTIHLVVRQC